jgi:hypothetical protein
MIEGLGTFVVVGMVTCYGLEARSVGWVLGFAFFCSMASLYAFWIESWPFFFVEGAWSGLAARRGFRRWAAEA